MQIDVDGLTITVSRKKIKNLNLRIHPTGDVHVSIPWRMPLDGAFHFIQNKRGWIENHRQRLLNTASSMPKEPLLQTGDTIYLLGQRIELNIHQTLQKNYVHFEQNRLHCYMTSPSTLEQKQQVINQWYREQMSLQLPELFKKWEAIIGVHVNQYGIKLMKTRWGSCNTTHKRIWLNLRLIHKPLICLEYVIAHELVHLLEPSHNKRFHALMTQFLPDWKSIKNLLEAR